MDSAFNRENTVNTLEPTHCDCFQSYQRLVLHSMMEVAVITPPLSSHASWNCRSPKYQEHDSLQSDSDHTEERVSMAVNYWKIVLGTPYITVIN